MHATIAKLAIDWLSVIPFTIHSVLQTALLPSASGPASIERCISYSDIVKYNTISRANSFFQNFSRQFLSLECEIFFRLKNWLSRTCEHINARHTRSTVLLRF